MALFFASKRWGDGEGIFNYSKEARAILRECLHQGEDGKGGAPMWEKSNHLIKFVTECDWSDPSYHLPHFYELFALWADEEDRLFWKEAAKASREYLKKPAIRRRDCAQSMPITMEVRIQDIRSSSADVMTGITATPTVRLPISDWIMHGLLRMSGNVRLQTGSSSFSARRKADGTMGSI